MGTEALGETLMETMTVFENGCEPWTTPEVAEELGVGRRAAYNRLDALVERGQLMTKKVGASARVWWRPPTEPAVTNDYRQGWMDTEWSCREDCQEFERLVEAVDEYTICSLDADGYVETWNPGAEETTGYEAEEVLGEHVSTFYPDEAVAACKPTDNLVAAAAHNSVTNEGWHVRADGSQFWAKVTITAIRDEQGRLVGYTEVTRDMTLQRDYERILKRQAEHIQRERDEVETDLDEMFDRMFDGFYALDENLRFRYLNESAADVLEVDESAVGRSIIELTTTTDDFKRALREVRDTAEPVVFEEHCEPRGRWFYNGIIPAESGILVYVRDITERKERETDLERTLDLLQKTERTADVGGWEIDTETLDVFWTDHLFEILEVPYEEEPPLEEALDIYHQDDQNQVEDAIYAALEAGEPFDIEARFQPPSGEVRWLHVQGVPETEDGEVVMLRGAAQDITERKERERALRETKSQLEAATKAGEVGTWEWYVPEDHMVTGPKFAETFGVDPDAAAEGVSLERFLAAIHEDDRDHVETAVQESLDSCGEYEEEYRVWNEDDELRWIVARGSVECDANGDPISFHGAIVDITAQKFSQLELERQRQQLAALNNINEVVSEITSAVIEQSTREEIEQTVCDALKETDAYEFAWLAEVDVNKDVFEPRATAGTGGYAEEITISLDSADPGSEGPAANAIRKQETQVIRDVFADPDFEPWREAARKYGYRAVASIPIVHEETVYGVLGVYADRENAFDTAEREVISQLGEVVGHAIAATERKQALMSDEVVELKFQLQDIFDLIGVSDATDDRITIEDAVPIGDDEFLVYGTTTPEGIETVQAFVEAAPHWDAVRVVSDGDSVDFEVHLTEPPVLSVVASHGGYIENFVIEDSDCQMTIHLPPNAEVRHAMEAVEEAYPSAEMLRRKQITRLAEDARHTNHHLLADLTDRQSAALDAAYHAGYFEWPRNTQATEVAESLGITPPTFSHHLRKAQQKLFDSLYASSL